MFLHNKYKIKEMSGEIETNEVFLDTLAKINEEKLGLSEKKFEVKIKEKLIYSIFAIFFIFCLIVFGKTFYLQVFNGNKLHGIAQNNMAKIGLISPQRGIIYDSKLKKLVLNAPAFDLVCDKRNLSLYPLEYAKEIDIIAKIFELQPAAITQQLQNAEESEVLISQNITQEKLLILETNINNLPDCQIEKNTTRNYITGPIFSHILGYTGKTNKEELQNNYNYTISDYIGKIGLEKYYEQFLRGTPGQVEVIKNASGIKKGDKILSEPTSGYNLVLHIDTDFQKKVYDSLEKSIKNIGAKKGAAVALNPKTGAILALVSYPAYDNNIFSSSISKEDFNKIQNDPNQPFFNRAISAQYPTGSTIKPFIAAGALQEKIISEDKIINDPGYILVQSKYDPEVVYRFGGVEPHGLVDMREALAVSSNIYFYTVGGGYKDQQGLGPTRIKKYLDLFGWEEKTGIDLTGEFKGFVPDAEWKKKNKNEAWWDGDTYNLSIGQSDLQVTPLQVALAYSAIANGGSLYKPQIVQKIIDGSGENAKTIQECDPEIVRSNFIDQENLKVVREGMRDGVLHGSSKMLSSIPVSIAGKTGTAETNKPGYFNTWSSNFAPYDDPEIVFVTTIEGVQGLRAATLPVAYDVLQWYFAHH